MPRSRSMSHVVEHLRAHLALAQPPAPLDQAVGERRLAVVDVRDDGEIADAGGVGASSPARLARAGAGDRGRAWVSNDAMSTIEQLASEYHRAVHAADSAAMRGEPEAQLTTPVAELFCGLAASAGLGELRMLRETPLGRTRPDFAALLTRGGRTVQKGFVELKAPTTGVDPAGLTGRNRTQWERMSQEAEILILCNGREARLFRNGQQQGATASLPFDNPAMWDARPLTNLLSRFLELTPLPVVNVRNLSERLAVRTADLRDRPVVADGSTGRRGWRSVERSSLLGRARRPPCHPT